MKAMLLHGARYEHLLLLMCCGTLGSTEASDQSSPRACIRTDENGSCRALSPSEVERVGLLQLSSEVLNVHASALPVTADMLHDLEQKYGGFVQHVVRHERAAHEEAGGDRYFSHEGGDRFSNDVHNYAPVYANYLSRLMEVVPSKPLLAEIGILKGSGIATWTELFPESPVHAFDIDLSNYESNIEFLKKQGFQNTNVHTHHFDQTLDNRQQVAAIFGEGKISMLTDDGCHTEMCARLTFHSFYPQMADKFVYFIEDSAVGPSLMQELHQLHGVNVEAVGQLTVVSRL